MKIDNNKNIQRMSAIERSDVKRIDREVWIKRDNSIEFMKNNDSLMVIPRLFGDGERTLIACRLRECPSKERCPNFCPCDIKCHCVSRNNNVGIA